MLFALPILIHLLLTAHGNFENSADLDEEVLIGKQRTIEDLITENDKIRYAISRHPGINPSIMDVYFGNMRVENGFILSEMLTQHEPKVHISMKPGIRYAVIMLTPDAPSASRPIYSPMLHWYVCNISTTSTKGVEVVGYMAPMPHDSELQDYALILLRQLAELPRVIVNVASVKFPLSQHIHQYNLSVEEIVHFKVGDKWMQDLFGIAENIEIF